MRKTPLAALASVLTALLAAAPLGAQTTPLPADAATATERLNASSRHGEWVRFDAGGGDSVRAWVVYPERPDRAPIVIVVHEIFGLTDWIRAVADQLAVEGFIAVAPDLLSGKGPGGGGTETLDQQTAIRLIRELPRPEVERRLQAAARYGRSLPAARDAVTSIGFCWGGSVSFRMAAFMPGLRGAVVYYGGSPDSTTLGQVAAPVLGLYAGDDARVNATIEPAQRELRRLGKRYEIETYDGAGHGFLRAQPERDGANQRASRRAWPRMLAFLREVTRG